MTGIHERTEPQPQPTPTGHADRHPAWCDRSRCTADPTSQAGGYRPGAGGEHRSAPIPLNLTTAVWLPARDGTAWLSEACAPWPCAVFLCVQVGEVELFMPADSAAPVLDALSTLLASAATVPEATR
ncbi:hypothetical protein [Micromonospora craniellae]|uniref:Uncharacterized protein n=1 Tax=Micromonospora craniellae TaxID=2294034 RepID=A0A372G5N3_9ACTN|nr:hypothetical protein [Micromonospora craniellae]QOC95410.1 hypothetical protein ID554_19200 [Micromonospora craniellae]RFS48303.1 hypothetical protein D0Q02_02135 [Micromonospora craniellae]